MKGGWIWLLVAAVVVGVIALAASVAPRALDDNESRVQLIYLCVILAALTGGLATRLQARPGTTLAHLGTWGGTPPAPEKYLDLSYYQKAFAGL